MAGNEELTREWFTVGRLLGREDVRHFALWVRKVRWKAREVDGDEGDLDLRRRLGGGGVGGRAFARINSCGAVDVHLQRLYTNVKAIQYCTA